MRIVHTFTQNLNPIEEVLKYVCSNSKTLHDLIGVEPYNTMPIVPYDSSTKAKVCYGFINGYYGIAMMEFANGFNDNSVHKWFSEFKLYHYGMVGDKSTKGLYAVLYHDFNENDKIEAMIHMNDDDSESQDVVIKHTKPILDNSKPDRVYDERMFSSIGDDYNFMPVKEFLMKYGMYGMRYIMDTIQLMTHPNDLNYIPYFPGSRRTAWDSSLWMLYKNPYYCGITPEFVANMNIKNNSIQLKN